MELYHDSGREDKSMVYEILKVGERNAREFDSLIKEKFIAGRIRPAFLLSNTLFYSIVFYCNMW